MFSNFFSLSTKSQMNTGCEWNFFFYLFIYTLKNKIASRLQWFHFYLAIFACFLYCFLIFAHFVETLSVYHGLVFVFFFGIGHFPFFLPSSFVDAHGTSSGHKNDPRIISSLGSAYYVLTSSKYRSISI